MDEKQHSYEWISISCLIIGAIYFAVGALSGTQLLWPGVAFFIVGMIIWPFRLDFE